MHHTKRELIKYVGNPARHLDGEGMCRNAARARGMLHTSQSELPLGRGHIIETVRERLFADYTNLSRNEYADNFD